MQRSMVPLVAMRVWTAPFGCSGGDGGGDSVPDDPEDGDGGAGGSTAGGGADAGAGAGASGSGCGTITFTGCCDGQTLVYCKDPSGAAPMSCPGDLGGGADGVRLCPL